MGKLVTSIWREREKYKRIRKVKERTSRGWGKISRRVRYGIHGVAGGPDAVSVSWREWKTGATRCYRGSNETKQVLYQACKSDLDALERQETSPRSKKRVEEKILLLFYL